MTKVLSRKAARQFLERCLNTGELTATKHCLGRMKRRGFDFDDVANVIRRGEILTVAYDSQHQNFKLAVAGEDLDGIELTLELGLEIEESLTIVITGF